MLLALILTGLYTILLNLLETPLIKSLKSSPSSISRVKIRGKIIRIRIYCTILICAILFCLNILPVLIVGDKDYINSPDFFNRDVKVTLMCFSYIIFILQRKVSKTPFSNISTLTKTSVLSRNKPYILYLRGFNCDEYESHHKLYSKKNNKQISNFSEFKFAQSIRKHFPIYAVGMTKEIESASGASRIYLEDSTWKQDVKILMKHAKAIIILINSSDSCIWEIEQSTQMLEKTYYIVDNMEEYKLSKQMLYGKISGLPLVIVPNDKILVFKILPKREYSLFEKTNGDCYNIGTKIAEDINQKNTFIKNEN